MPRPTPSVPTDLQELSGRFEDWRRTRRGKLPIPEPLWAAAAELARSYGVCQTAQVLRLEYKKLKPLTDGQAGSKPVRRRRAPAPAIFMEPAPPPTAAAKESEISSSAMRLCCPLQTTATPLYPALCTRQANRQKFVSLLLRYSASFCIKFQNSDVRSRSPGLRMRIRHGDALAISRLGGERRRTCSLYCFTRPAART